MCPADKWSFLDNQCDVLIIGGGIIGVSTAFYLSQEDPKLKIIVLEKNSCGHDRASSYGESRMYRKMYSKAYFSQMQTEALKMWRQLEKVGKSMCISLLPS